MNRDEAKKIYSGNGTDTVANREALEEGRGGGSVTKFDATTKGRSERRS